MGLFQRFKDWRTKRWLEKLEAGIKMLNNRINFDPRYAYDLDDVDTPERYTRRMQEYRVWYIGNNHLLRQLYSKNIKDGSHNYFWYKAPDNYRMLHSGIPSLISTKMSTVLFGSGLKVEVLVYNEQGEIDQAASGQAQELVDNLMRIMNVIQNFKAIAVNESWSGDGFAKLSHDIGLSDYPILENATVQNAEAIVERGILVGVVFKYWYEHKNKRYRLDEVYTQNNEKDAVIRYELYELRADGTEKIVDLETIPEGAELKEYLNEDNEFVYKGLKRMLAFYKPNKTPSQEFMNTHHGASDYEGALDSFDALDEAYSELIAELRLNKTIRYIPDSMIPTVEIDGRIMSVLDDEFVTNYVRVAGDLDQDSRNEIKIQQIPDKTLQHVEKFKIALNTAVNKAGLSLVALGVVGIESINSSAESQQERNKATLETRGSKIELWEPFAENIIETILEMNSWMQKNLPVKQDAFAKLDLNFDNLTVNVNFSDYILERRSEKIDVWGSAKSQKVASTYTAVKQIWQDDWTEEQILEEVNRIRFEEGMSLDDPNNLPELTGFENEEDELEKLEDEGEPVNEEQRTGTE